MDYRRLAGTLPAGVPTIGVRKIKITAAFEPWKGRKYNSEGHRP